MIAHVVMDHRIKMDDASFTVAFPIKTRKADDGKTPMQPAIGKLQIQMVNRIFQAAPERINEVTLYVVWMSISAYLS